MSIEALRKLSVRLGRVEVDRHEKTRWSV